PPHRGDQVVDSESGDERTRVIGGDEPHVDAQPALQRHPLLESGEIVTIGDEEQITDLAIAWIDAELLGKTLEDGDGLQREANLGLCSELGPDPARRLGRRAGSDGVAFENEHVAKSSKRQVIGEAAADDTPTDDDDVGGARERHRAVRGPSPATTLAWTIRTSETISKTGRPVARWMSSV